MNILILAAGAVSQGFESTYPVWLAEAEGELVIERQIKALSALEPEKMIFVFRQSDVRTHFLHDIVSQMFSGAIVIEVVGQTAGAACTALLTCGVIDMDSELVVASATDQIDANLSTIIRGFRERNADAGVLTFPSLHPRYSYVRVDAEGRVLESSEKRPISRNASSGMYWFAKAADFFAAVKSMILKDAHVQDHFYICPALNELILAQKMILAHPLDIDQYHPLKTTKQVEHFESLLDGKP